MKLSIGQEFLQQTQKSMNKEEKIQKLINLIKEKERLQGAFDNAFYPFHYSGFNKLIKSKI